jgi:hypothetical protein
MKVTQTFVALLLRDADTFYEPLSAILSVVMKVTQPMMVYHPGGTDTFYKSLSAILPAVMTVNSNLDALLLRKYRRLLRVAFSHPTGGLESDPILRYCVVPEVTTLSMN